VRRLWAAAEDIPPRTSRRGRRGAPAGSTCRRPAAGGPGTPSSRQPRHGNWPRRRLAPARAALRGGDPVLRHDPSPLRRMSSPGQTLGMVSQSHPAAVRLGPGGEVLLGHTHLSTGKRRTFAGTLPEPRRGWTSQDTARGSRSQPNLHNRPWPNPYNQLHRCPQRNIVAQHNIPSLSLELGLPQVDPDCVS
jgi:hypothetical protein